jgi:hypothetical protein
MKTTRFEVLTPEDVERIHSASMEILAEVGLVYRSVGHAHSLLFYYPTDLYIDAMPFYTQEYKRHIRKWTGEGLIRARNFKGLVGPLAYEIKKRF